MLKAQITSQEPWGQFSSKMCTHTWLLFPFSLCKLLCADPLLLRRIPHHLILPS